MVEAFVCAQCADRANAQYSLDCAALQYGAWFEHAAAACSEIDFGGGAWRARGSLLDDREQLGRDRDMLTLERASEHRGAGVQLIKDFARICSPAGRYFVQSEHLRRRMHIKMWLADGVLGITGGRNLSDRYLNAGEEDNSRTWMCCSRGHVAADMQKVLMRIGTRNRSWAWDDFDAKYLELRREQIAQMLLSTNRLTRKERVQRHPYLQVPQANRGQHVGRSGEPHGGAKFAF